MRAAGAGPHAHDAFLLISASYTKTDKTSGARQPLQQTRVLATHRELEEVSSRWGPVMGQKAENELHRTCTIDSDAIELVSHRQCWCR